MAWHEHFTSEHEREIQADLLSVAERGAHVTELRACTLPGIAFRSGASADVAGKADDSYSSAKVNMFLYYCFVLSFICRCN